MTNTRLKRLLLGGNHLIKDAGAQALARVLSTNSVIGETGALSYAESADYGRGVGVAPKGHQGAGPGLEELDLWNCGIMEEGCRLLCDSVEQRQAIRSLSLKFNKVWGLGFGVWGLGIRRLSHCY
jgi:hypothetical protein